MAKKVLVTIDVTASGKLGGDARAANMTPKERSESARKAALARWGPKKKAAKKEGAK